MKLLEALNKYLFGTCLPPLLLAAGLFFGVRLSFFFFLHPRRTLCRLAGDGGWRASFRALCVALAGTLGVGNITGVGIALAIGGEGAVFWMVAGGLFASFLKYAEITLAVDLGRGGHGRGAPDYIATGLGEGYARLFTLLTVALSLSMGSLLQGNVIAAAAADTLPIRPISLGLLLSGTALLLFLGGQKGVERLAALCMPILTLLYVLAAITIIFVNITSLPSVLSRILRGAFTPGGAGGGLLGFGAGRAIRAGIQKGLFSNEAGAGTAPFAHVAARGVPAARQGIFGVVEVFLDTVVMCSLTALAVLSVFDPLPNLSGTALIAAAFAGVFGARAPLVISLAIIAFSYATVACWVSYGRLALGQLCTSPHLATLYALLFSALLTVGALWQADGAWALCDILLGSMTVINTAALFKHSAHLQRLAREYGLT